MTKKAFTLIELLVIIAIIGILATISVIALQNARAKSRDAKRAGDIKQVQTALELFFNDKSRYPTVDEWNTGKIFSTGTNSTSTYMQIIPSAPTPNDGSCTTNQNSINYFPNPDGSSYSISFCLGNTTGTLTPGPKCLTPGGIVDVDCSEPLAAPCSITTVGGTPCSYGGENYPTVTIGTQVWLAKNLNIGTMIGSKLADNTSLQDQTDNSVIEKYCYGYIQDGNAGQMATGSSNCSTYGALYQWNEAMQYSLSEGAQGICPAGWHIPSDSEQFTLEDYLKDFGQNCDFGRTTWDCFGAGTKMKVGGTSDFEAPIAGLRFNDGSFTGQGDNGFFWSSSVDSANAWYRALYSLGEEVNRNVFDQTIGLPIRCLQD